VSRTYEGRFTQSLKRYLNQSLTWLGSSSSAPNHQGDEGKEEPEERGVSETVRFDHIREHYFRSHPSINPHAIIPLGPELDWWEPL